MKATLIKQTTKANKYNEINLAQEFNYEFRHRQKEKLIITILKKRKGIKYAKEQ